MQKDHREIDYEAIEAIAGNCKSSEYEECKRLLIKQKDELIEKIFYELMYDKDGNENDFIPTCCTYDQLLDILLKLGGKEETFGEKSRRKVRRTIKEYETKIKEKKNELENLELEYRKKHQTLETEYQQKIIELSKKYEQKTKELTQDYFETIQGQIEWQERNIRVLNGVVKYKSSNEKISVLETISKKKLIIGKMREELKCNVVGL